LHEQCHVVERLIERAVLVSDFRRQHRHFEAQRSKQSAKRAVQLIAESSAAKLNDLVNEFFFVEHDGTPEMNVEILEGNVEQVSTMQFNQISQRWDARAVVVYSFEIRFDVHRAMQYRPTIETRSTLAKKKGSPKAPEEVLTRGRFKHYNLLQLTSRIRSCNAPEFDRTARPACRPDR